MKRLAISLLLICASWAFPACHTSKSLKAVNTTNAPKAIGPYSQSVQTGAFVFCSGQIGLVPETGVLVNDQVADQARQALKNLAAVLGASGSDMEHVIKTTIYLKNIADFAKVNEVYANFFPSLKPARSTVQVAALPKEALIEIECIAVKK